VTIKNYLLYFLMIRR